ncbi:hypothetical protein HOP54_08830 [Halomonas daqingensis]|uniref:Uncharacterized protein n=1 Tax=Billgrantia desiderata TaxID=52021 RepID=A0ABS9B7J1_9GAMM|nr:hypothetical protein [Halomonas desiderata]MCE8028792.1 hypothetical protein [Halomonas desiderata]MCE8043609.1 hypothetical protein [Halomonas desiderata]MCE8048183.1 hypothetical protein [Halomonas desiderata]
MEPLIVKISELPVDYMGLLIPALIAIILSVFAHFSSKWAESRANKFTLARIREQERQEAKKICRERCEELYRDFMEFRSIKLRVIYLNEYIDTIEGEVKEAEEQETAKAVSRLTKSLLHSEHLRVQKEKSKTVVNMYRHAAKVEEIIGKESCHQMQELLKEEVVKTKDGERVSEELSQKFIIELNKIEHEIDCM